jgi:hypothetical protein
MWFTILLGIGAMLSFAALVHCIYLTIYAPDEFLRRVPRYTWSLRDRAYVGLVLIGAFVFGYGGTESFFFWLPGSIGTYDDGDFLSLKHGISTLCGCFFTLFLVGRLENVARAAVELKVKNIKGREMERIIRANDAALESLQVEYKQKAEEPWKASRAADIEKYDVAQYEYSGTYSELADLANPDLRRGRA